MDFIGSLNKIDTMASFSGPPRSFHRRRLGLNSLALRGSPLLWKLTSVPQPLAIPNPPPPEAAAAVPAAAIPVVACRASEDSCGRVSSTCNFRLPWILLPRRRTSRWDSTPPRLPTLLRASMIRFRSAWILPAEKVPCHSDRSRCSCLINSLKT